MSRPNTTRKLKQRIIRILLKDPDALAADEIARRLIIEATKTGYPEPDFYKVRATLGTLYEENKVERLEPELPPGAYVSGNRELAAMWSRWTKFRIPPLVRLAMLVDEKDDCAPDA